MWAGGTPELVPGSGTLISMGGWCGSPYRTHETMGAHPTKSTACTGTGCQALVLVPDGSRARPGVRRPRTLAPHLFSCTEHSPAPVQPGSSCWRIFSTSFLKAGRSRSTTDLVAFEGGPPLRGDALDPLDSGEDVSQAFGIAPHRGMASRRICSRILGLRPRSVATSTGLSRSCSRSTFKAA